jgi:hypothetical protein
VGAPDQPVTDRGGDLLGSTEGQQRVGGLAGRELGDLVAALGVPTDLDVGGGERTGLVVELGQLIESGSVPHHASRQSSDIRCEPACGPICSIPPSTTHDAPVT